MCASSPTYEDYIDSENLPFVDPADAGSVARWRSALNELVVNGLIERFDAVYRFFGVTRRASVSLRAYQLRRSCLTSRFTRHAS